tara:strand:+ start:2088 stop:2387 length:300 start_codon:yes stop_codon:yes gene_type:complete
MGKPSQQTQPQPEPQTTPTPVAEPVKPEPKIEPIDATETASVSPKSAVGASAGGGYAGTGKKRTRTMLSGPGGLAGAAPVRRPMLTGSMGGAYKTTLGG